MNYWKQNLSLLEQKNPSLAKYIAGIGNSGHVSVVESESGLPTLKIIDGIREEGFLLSPKNPSLEAQNLLNDISFNAEDGTLMFGFGLGYLVREISRKKSPDHVLCVLEGVPELFKLAMTCMDLSSVLSDNNIYLFVGDFIYTILDHFTPIQKKSITGNISKLAMPSLRKLCEKQYDAIDRQIDDYVTFLKKSFSSFRLSKESRLVNVFRNLPAMLNSYPVDALKGVMSGKPAIIVAAGPSLKTDIESLVNRPAESMIFCVDAALKPLLINDIKPDWVVTCDPYPDNYNKVDGLPKVELQDLPLIFQGEALPRIIDRFTGPKFVVNAHNSLINWVTNIGRSIDTIPFFPSVAHFGFLMARYMGADPIIFVGLDLSFPIDQEHADGCAQTWTLDFNKTEFLQVSNNTGGEVKTIPNFLSMIHSLEYEIQRTKARCINVSKDGAKIRGAEWLPLEKVFALIQNHKIDDRSENINFNTVELKNGISMDDISCFFENITEKVSFVDSAKLIEKCSAALSWMISEVEELMLICKDAKATFDLSKTSHKKPIEKTIALEQLKTAYASAFEHKELLNVLTDYLPRYMMLMSKYQSENFAAEHVSSIIADQKRITVFFEELFDVLLLLEKCCRSSLDCIRAC